MSSEPRIILCGEATADSVAESPKVLRLWTSGTNANVHLRIEDISRSLMNSIPPQLIDLIEIATFVYVADQSFSRGGADVEDMGANWRRPLQFEIPVRCLDLWKRTDVASALRDVLSFLSEDEYTFAFRQYKHPPAIDSYLNFTDLDYASKPESVVLFSGGLDSLGGAVREIVVDGRPVVLVTHQSTTKLINRHRTLRTLLHERAIGPKPLHVTIGINKDELLNHEYTQRSRSFLYASLATAIAHMSGLNEIRFYENGTVSLNLPISRQVVGAKATRTTHPKTLVGFQQLFSLITGSPFVVSNRFLWMTKGEVVKSIVDAGCGGMIEWSTSCTHTWEISNEQPHCGKCSQCVDRRFAVLAAGAGSLERAKSYGVDLLTDPRQKGESRTMLVSYVETARQVANMSELDFFIRFGEVARIVRHLGGSADENARKVHDLFRRHGRDVSHVVEAALSENVTKILSRSLPDSCLLRLAHDLSVPGEWGGDSASPAPALPVKAEAKYMLVQRGEGWQLRFDGRETIFLKPAIGYAYLRELLRFPGKRYSVNELLVILHGAKANIPLGDGGELLDKQAKQAYAQHLDDLDGQIEDARLNDDKARLSELAVARSKVMAQLRAAGFKRNAKRTNSDLNKIRNSVGNAIKRVLKKIQKYEPSAFAHLKSNVSLGFTVSYAPAQPPTWNL